MKSLESLGSLVTSWPFMSVIVASLPFNPIIGILLSALVVAALLDVNAKAETNNEKTNKITKNRRETRLPSRF